MPIILTFALSAGVDEWLQVNKHCPFCKKAVDEKDEDTAILMEENEP